MSLNCSPYEFLQFFFGLTEVQFSPVLCGEFVASWNNGLVSAVAIQEGDRTITLHLDLHREHRLHFVCRFLRRQKFRRRQISWRERWHVLLRLFQELLQFLWSSRFVVATFNEKTALKKHTRKPLSTIQQCPLFYFSSLNVKEFVPAKQDRKENLLLYSAANCRDLLVEQSTSSPFSARLTGQY